MSHVSCTVWIDGVRVADGSPGDVDESAPTALAGLGITWGRSTTVDQPDPATCTFDVMDLAGGATFLGLLYVGAAVAVRAAGTVLSPPVLPVNADPSFEQAALGVPPPLWDIPPSRAVQVFRGNADQVNTGANAVGMQATATGGRTAIYARPALGSSPAAWDDLPRARLGEHWAAQLWWSGPLGARLTVAVLSYAAPAAVPAVVPSAAAATSAGFGWTFLDAPVTIPAAAADTWIGMSLDITWPAWSAGHGTWQDYPDTWGDAALAYVDDQTILAPDAAGIVDRDVLVFAGRITDVAARWDDSVGGVVAAVTAADFTADLGNRIVSDTPWPAQTVTARFGRILTAADAAVAYRIDPAFGPQQMSWLDVDTQPALGLLQDVAASVDGVLWAAIHQNTAPVLWLADPGLQSALYQLDMQGGVVVIVPTAAHANAIDVDACDVLRGPVTFRQAAADVTTRVTVGWQEQTVDDGGNPAPTDRTVTLIDAAAELELGTRNLSVATLLTTAAAANTLAARILARLRRQSWRASGLLFDTTAVDMDPRQTAAALDLLDGVRRLNAPILLTNLPWWAPAGPTVPMFLQGGTYNFDGGGWALDLTTASAQSQGTSLPWNQVDPGYAWNEFDPGIAWIDLIGVAP